MIDGDDDPVVLSYRWTAGGVEVASTATLPAALFTHGDDVRCVASGADEGGVGPQLEAVATWLL